MSAPKLTQAQRRVLRKLVEVGGRKLVVGGEFPTRTLHKLEELGWITIERGGTSQKHEKYSFSVFTPGPSTAVLTDEGREVEFRDRTGVGL